MAGSRGPPGHAGAGSAMIGAEGIPACAITGARGNIGEWRRGATRQIRSFTRASGSRAEPRSPNIWPRVAARRYRRCRRCCLATMAMSSGRSPPAPSEAPPVQLRGAGVSKPQGAGDLSRAAPQSTRPVGREPADLSPRRHRGRAGRPTVSTNVAPAAASNAITTHHAQAFRKPRRPRRVSGLKRQPVLG